MCVQYIVFDGFFFVIDQQEKVLIYWIVQENSRKMETLFQNAYD